MVRSRTLLIVILCLFMVACSRQRRPDSAIATEPIRATNVAAQAQFDSAFEALLAGEYERAAEGFQLVQAEFPTDAIRPLAEVYMARSMLGDRRADTPSLRQALPLLTQLAKNEDLDPRIRWSAAIYRAFGLSVVSGFEEGLLALQKYPGPSLSPVVTAIDADTPDAWGFVIEALDRAHRSEEALMACDGLYSWLQARSQDETDDSLMDYAHSRAFALAERMSDEERQKIWVEGDSNLARAAVGWWLVKGATVRGEEAVVEELLAATTGFLLAIGGGERAAELTVLAADSQTESRFVIGALLPLTGPSRAVGMRTAEGLLLAQQAYRRERAPTTTLIIQNSQADAKEVMARFEKAGVQAIIGPIERRDADRFASLAASSGLPMIMLTLDRPTIESGLAPFRFFLDVDAEVAAVARLSAQVVGDRRAVIIAPDIPYGHQAAKRFRAVFESLGGTIVLDERYDPSRVDFSTLAGRVQRASADAIFIPDVGLRVAQITAFLAEQNVWGIGADRKAGVIDRRQRVHYLGTSLWNDPRLLAQAGSYLNGAIIPSWYSPVFEGAAIAYFQSTQEVFRRHPEPLETFAYDAFHLLRSLLVDRNVRDRERLVEALKGPATYRGVTGTVRFRADGEPVRPLRFTTIGPSGLAALPWSYMTGVSEDPADLRLIGDVDVTDGAE